MGDPGGAGGLFGGAVEVVVEPGAQRGDPHRRAVAEAALAAEEGGGQRLPFAGGGGDAGQQGVHTGAVTAAGVGLVACGEALCERLRPHLAMCLQDGEQLQRHGGVVRPVPVRVGRCDALRDQPAGLGLGAEQPEEALPEGIAERQPLDAPACRGPSSVIHAGILP